MNKTRLFLILAVTTSIITTIEIAYAEDKIGIFTLNSDISTRDNILVTGFVNADSSYKPVKLEVYDPSGDLLYKPDVYFNGDGQFSWLFHPPLGKFKQTGIYSIVASHEEVSETAELFFTVKSETIDSSVTNPIATNDPKEITNSNTLESSDKNNFEEQQNFNNNSIQTNNEATVETIFTTILIIIIIGVIVGVIMWMRNTYEKPLSQ